MSHGISYQMTFIVASIRKLTIIYVISHYRAIKRSKPFWLFVILLSIEFTKCRFDLYFYFCLQQSPQWQIQTKSSPLFHSIGFPLAELDIVWRQLDGFPIVLSTFFSPNNIALFPIEGLANWFLKGRTSR